jgi:hypothetical protein
MRIGHTSDSYGGGCRRGWCWLGTSGFLPADASTIVV